VRILFIFPHPDDESFGPAPALHALHRAGHDVYLLTLTRGEATKERFALGYSKGEMGVIRKAEVEAAAAVLGVKQTTVLNLPDGELATLDPRSIEDVITEALEAHSPDVVVTYAVHGISGHPDHLAGHACVKRAYCAWKPADRPTRLAFFTIDGGDPAPRPAHLKATPRERIAIRLVPTPEDLAKGHEALAQYVTYARVVAEHQPMRTVEAGVCFELFQECPNEVLECLTTALKE